MMAPAGAGFALGGGGLARLLVHLVIWHLIWRAAFALWRIPTFGPVIVIVLVIALVAAGVYRSRRGTIWPRRSGRGRYGYGTGDGPRDW
jgi:hypothetical protein